MEELMQTIRGVIALLSPVPGACGSTPEDVAFAIAPAEPIDEAAEGAVDNEEDTLRLLRSTLAEDTFWQRRNDEYESVLLTEGDAGETLAACRAQLEQDTDGALAAALKEYPGLTTNLRAGATVHLEAAILKHIEQKVALVNAADSIDEQAAILQTFFEVAKDGVKGLPPMNMMKQRVKASLAQVASIQAAAVLEQKTKRIVQSVAVVRSSEGGENVQAAWETLAGALAQCEGIKATEGEQKTTLNDFVGNVVEKIRQAKSVESMDMTLARIELVRQVSCVGGIADLTATTVLNLAELALKLDHTYRSFIGLADGNIAECIRKD